jgi:two-component system CheB/CheR fusion protein
MRILPYRVSNDVVDGALITFVEVTNMVRAEQQQRTLVEELNHRVRNMLTVVSAIASQTLSKTPEPADFADAFMGRIHSLGQTYSLVSQRQWGDVSLHDMLMAELRPHAEEDGRVALSGPPITFRPPDALALGLVFHELVTNAAKYGSLSNGSGRLSVTWKIGNPGLVIEWREADGPKVAKPKRRGFGTELIERQLKESIKGSAKFTYAADGLRVVIDIPQGTFSQGSAGH